MFRTAIVFLASAALSVAFACPNNADCTASSCTKKADAPTDMTDVEGTRTKLAVKGMTCGSCANGVKAAIMGVEGVKAANVDHETGAAEVVFDEAKTDANAIATAVNGTAKFSAEVSAN